MNLKRYRVQNIQEALQLIKKDLGPEAVIVSTRQVKEGNKTFGLFAKTMLEVTAAKDDKSSPKPASAANLTGYRATVNGAPKPDGVTTPTATATQPPVAKAPASAPAVHTNPSSNPLSADSQRMLQPLRQEIQDLREMIRTLGDRSASYEEQTVAQLKQELGEMRYMLHSLASRSSLQDDLQLPENLMVLYQQLRFSGMEDKFARRLMLEAQKNIAEEDLQNFSYVKIFIARMLMKIVKTTRGVENITSPQKIFSLIGPTGVGKTTTAAKIASEQLLRYKRRVALITIDTFRIAAVEQLRTYAKIINVPLSIVADKADLDRAIASYSDYDVIVIDTGGCSQRDDAQMFELREMFDERGRLHNILVLSTTTKDSDMNEITRRFGIIPIDGVIFTKLDESSSYGSIFNHSIRFKKPISFLTTGQKVPEDIEVATKERLVDLMLNISGN
jgi:flagellar biosynthesis protein FlhF